MNRILIVEDHEATVAFFRETLEEAGYQTRAVGTGPEALCALGDFEPRLVLLDIGLEGAMDGFAVLGALRQKSDAYVMIITGRGRPADVVQGLTLQADDYLVKPISRDELLARVQARLRREMRQPSGGVFRFGDLTIDLWAQTVELDGLKRVLGQVETNLLARLLETPGHVVSGRELLRAGWGVNTQTVDSYGLLGPAIHRLRAKLGDSRSSKRRALLVTVRSRGYRIAAPDETKSEASAE